MNTWKCKAFVMAMLLLVSTTYQAAAQVKAKFTANITHACSPLIAQFTDQSTGNPTSWHWDFGNGNVSTQKNPGAVYLQPGFRTVELIVSDGTTSDTLVMPNYIEVYTNPVAKFGETLAQGCAPFQVCFTDSSIKGSGGLAGWHWDFGDGQSDSVQNPCVTLATPGVFPVSLFVEDSNGCSNQKLVPKLLTIVAAPVANFTSNINSSCTPPLSVKFQNNSQSSGSLSYAWSFGDGGTSNLTSPSHNYNSLGNYNVTLIAFSSYGCSDTMVKPDFVAVEQIVAKFAAPKHGCIGSPVPFIDSSTSNPNVWRWDFGDGDTSQQQYPQHVYKKAGTYTIKYYVANTTCADSIVDSNYITIDPSPTASFTSNDSGGCTLPYVVQFTDHSKNAVRWKWNFGDTTSDTIQDPQHIYTQPGNYTVSLTVINTNGCANTITKTNDINVEEPKAAFTADTVKGCIPLTVTFADSSTSFEQIVLWQWDFGDGTTSNLQNPQHTFTSDSIYTIKLVIVNSAGCTDTLVKTGYISAGTKPVATFTALPVSTCMYTPVSFSDHSDSTNEWFWSFGDGSTSLSENPSHVYSDTGYFNITFIAMHNGCADTLVEPRYIHISPPHAAFVAVQNCTNPYTVQFNDQSLAPNSWYWSFGDSTNSSLQNPQHTYAHRGTFTVTLTVTDTVSGCFDIYAKPVEITQPVALFSAPDSTGCRPFAASIIDSSIDAVSYVWKTDGMSSSAQNPVFLYTIPGVYSVTEIITDLNSCVDSITKPLYITVKGPTANFGANPLNGCVPLKVDFTDSSVAYLGPIVSWLWQFGDGDSSTLQNPSHVFQTTSPSTVTLTVTDANGCSHTLTKNNFVKPTFPKPYFIIPPLTCTGKQVLYNNLSISAGGTFHWQFGDGDTTDYVSPTHEYAQEGVYTVTLKVTDINGCDSSLSKTITVSNPVARFAADTMFSACPPMVVNFKDTSFGSPVSWQWDFGDGGTSLLQNPSHIYRRPGSFTVKLFITTATGCTDSITKPGFIVVDGPTGNFTFTPDSICEGGGVTFNAVTVNTYLRTWDFGDGNVLPEADTTQHIYDSTGVYHPFLILQDSIGCVFPIAAADSIIVGNLNVAFTAAPQYLCKDGNVTFTDKSVGSTKIRSWFWDFGDGGTSTAQNPVHYYSQPGVYTVKLRAVNGTCNDSIIDSNLIVVDSGPKASFVYNATPSCVPYSAQFHNTSFSESPVASILWSFGDGNTDTVQDPAHFYPAAGVYTVSLMVLSITGCSDTAFKTLVVHAVPVVTVSNDTAICYGYSTMLQVGGGVTYQWSPRTGLSDSTVANPLANPTVTTDYLVLVTDSNNCQATDSVKVWVNPLPVAVITPDTVICAGNSVQLLVNGGSAYQWSPFTTLTCSNCYSPLATPFTTTNYKVKVVDSAGCFVYDSVVITVNPMPAGLLQHNISICQHDTTQLASNGGTTFSWMPSAGLSCSDCSSPTAWPDSTTNYVLTIANQYNCGFDDTVTVVVNPLPKLILKGLQNICQGASATISAFGADNYIWTPATGLNCANCASPVTTPSNNITYYLEGVSDFGCKSFDSISITVNPMPQIQTIKGLTLCQGDSVPLTTTVTNADIFSWSPAVGLSDSTVMSPFASPMVTTQYTIYASNQFGCTSADSVLITSLKNVVATASGDTTICIGNTVPLHAQILQQGYSGATFVWTPLDDLQNGTTLNPTATPKETRQYAFIASSGSCVPDTEKVTVTVNPLPFISIAAIEPVVNNTIVKLENSVSPNVVSYSWTPADSLSCANCAHPEFISDDGQHTFRLTVTDDNGCQSTDSVTVNDIGSCGTDVFVPNLFTPNGDEVNDKLYVRGVGTTGLKTFRIFDRWGNEVFQTTDINQGWDGTWRSMPLNAGVYIYFAEINCTNGQTYLKKGNVTLMR